MLNLSSEVFISFLAPERSTTVDTLSLLSIDVFTFSGVMLLRESMTSFVGSCIFSISANVGFTPWTPSTIDWKWIGGLISSEGLDLHAEVKEQLAYLITYNLLLQMIFGLKKCTCMLNIHDQKIMKTHKIKHNKMYSNNVKNSRLGSPKSTAPSDEPTSSIIFTEILWHESSLLRFKTRFALSNRLARTTLNFSC